MAFISLRHLLDHAGLVRLDTAALQRGARAHLQLRVKQKMLAP
jgi:hypothetical protein